MKRSYLGVLFLLSVGGTVCAATGIIVDKQGLSVSNAEIEALLKPAPANVQVELLKKKTDLQEKLQEIYLSKAIAEAVKKQPLTADEQAALDETLRMFYFNLKIKQLSEQNLPDFEPLAAVEYKANKEKYVEPEQVAIEHILLDTRKKYKDKDALKLAKTLSTQLKKGADFTALALKYSDDPLVKENKGRLGLFPKGKMLQAFEEVAYKLKLNEVSDPVETKYGYHVLRKYDQKPGGVKTYAAAKEEIIAKIKNEYVQNRLNGYYEKTKADNAMKIDDKALDAYIAEKTKQLEAEVKPTAVPTAVK
ncbi:MAG: peptidylprolyl isomerase [Methylococcales bacterium]